MATTATAVLSRRETKAAQLLARIADANDRGEYPTKAAVIDQHLSSKGRANQYRIIDGLVSRGLVLPGRGAKGYALSVTDAGRTELATW